MSAHQDQIAKVAQLLLGLVEQGVAVMRDAREINDVAAEREAGAEAGGTDGNG